MEDKNELNDILIKNGEKGGNNLKNILLFAAVTLLVFFIGVLAFKMVSQDEAKERAQAVLPAGPDSAVQQSFEKEPLSEGNANEAMKAYTAMLEEKRRQKETEQAAEAVPEAPEAVAEDNAIDAKIPESTPPAPEPEPEATKPEVKSEPKPSILDESKKPVAQPKPAKAGKQYYIQMASLIKEPNKPYLARITKNGFNYEIVKKPVDGSLVGKQQEKVIVHRIYIGPYKTKDEAKKALEKVLEVFASTDERSRPFITQK